MSLLQIYTFFSFFFRRDVFFSPLGLPSFRSTFLSIISLLVFPSYKGELWNKNFSPK